MNRWILLAGLILAFYFAHQINTGKITVNDVFKVVVETSEEKFVEEDGDGEEEIEAVIGEDVDEDGDDEETSKDVNVVEFPGGRQATGAGRYVAVEGETEIEAEIEAEDEGIRILAFGDMMLGRYVRSLMDENGKDYVFAKMPEGFFDGYDIVFGNLEGPLKGQGRKGGTSMVFSFNEDVAAFLKEWGFTLVSIANNHAVDQGWPGRGTTMEALNNVDLGWCGHPSETDADSVYYDEVSGETYAFICFHDVTFKLDDEAAQELIREIRPNVDYLIVSIHWGNEYQHKPNLNKQVHPGRAFIDAGADAVIGHHPHVVQSFEVYKGRLIFYSLGNFVFDQYWSKDTQEELALGIELSDEPFKTTVYLYPMKSSMSQSRLMNDEERAEWIKRFIGYGVYDAKMKEMIRKGIIEVE